MTLVLNAKEISEAIGLWLKSKGHAGKCVLRLEVDGYTEEFTAVVIFEEQKPITSGGIDS